MAYNVLVVDDSKITRQVVKKAIRMSGIELGSLWEAGDGCDALRILGDEWVDVVFADINMPRMSGVELVARMAEDETLRHTPVVIISANRSADQIASLKALGVRGYLTKPFRPEQVGEVIHHLLGPSGGNGHAHG